MSGVGVQRVRFALAAGAIAVAGGLFQAFVLGRELGAFHNVEEGFSVYVAREVLDGTLRASWTLHQYSPYEGGTLWFGLLCIPAVAVLGPTLGAAKLVAIAWSVATSLAVALATARLVSRRAALAATSLVAFGPPGWVIRGTQAVGDTHKSLLFVALQLWAWGGAVEPAARRRDGVLWALVLGLVCGLGISFSLAVVPAAGLALAGLIAARRVAGARLVGVALVATAAGMAIPLWNLSR